MCIASSYGLVSLCFKVTAELGKCFLTRICPAVARERVRLPGLPRAQRQGVGDRNAAGELGASAFALASPVEVLESGPPS